MNTSNIQESHIISKYSQNQNLQPYQPNNQNNNLSFSNSNLRNTGYDPNQSQFNQFNQVNPNVPQNNFANQNQSNFMPNNLGPAQNLGSSQNPGLYDPKFMGVNWETAQTQHSEVKISRSCWLGYHRNNYHPSMTQYRISYDEFNSMVDKIEEVASSFKWIQTFYILMVLLGTFSIILFVIGLFIEPGESVTDYSVFESLDNASTGLIVSGLLIFFIGGAVISLIIVSSLKRYEFNIRRMLQTENQHSYSSRSIQWLTTPYCQYVEIKCLPVTAQQYYLMLQQTNQLKISKEHLKKLQDGK